MKRALRTSFEASRYRQRGAAFYLFVVVMIGAMAATLFGATTALHGRSAADRASDQLLLDAKRLLLTHLSTPELDGSGRRLGEWRLFADLPIAAGAGMDVSEPNYDGNAESAGCAFRGWAPGQALQLPSASLAAARCIGRLPWQQLGLAMPQSDGNDDAVVPWVVFSANLAAPPACWPDFTPLSLAQAYAGYVCSGAPPYRWLTVVDARGNLLSDRVAFVLFAPGPPLAGQSRGAGAGPAAYLDQVTIGAACPLPCQPGSYNNGNLNQADANPTVLIQAPSDPAAAQRLGYFAEPYQFNDRLIFVTIDELMVVLQERAKRELTRALLAYRTSHGYFPFAAAFNTSAGDCVAANRFGHPAIADGNCGAGASLTLPSWFINAGWHRYFVYSVSARCVAGNNACNAPGLVVAANNAVNALVIAPGMAISAAPFALSRGAAQQPLSGLALSAAPSDYLDSVENAAGAADVFEQTMGLPAPSNDHLEIIN